MNSAEAELKRRRERGRLAQGVYRKRQAQAKLSMAAENAALKSAIAAIAGEVTSNDRSSLRAKIREAAQVAGLDQASQTPSNSKCNQPVSLHSVSAQDSLHALDQHHTEGCASSISSRTGCSSLSPGSSGSSLVSNHQKNGLDTFSAQPLPIYPDPLHCYPCAEGAAVVLPFLGQNAFTFAGLVFWNLVVRHEIQVHSQEPVDWWQSRKSQLLQYTGIMPESPKGVPELANLAVKLPAKVLSGFEDWVARVESRLAYYQDQSAGINTALQSAKPTNNTLGHENLNGTAHELLSPTKIEERIRSIVGDEVFSMMTTPSIERWRKNKCSIEQAENAELIDGLLEQLSQTWVCNGHGPHWNAHVFDSIFREWCSMITGGQIGLAEAGSKVL